MDIHIHSINFVIAKELEDFLKRKLHKLISITDRMISVDIYLKLEKPESYNNKLVEVKLHAGFGHFFAKKLSNSFEESANLVSQALRKQIIKNKKK